MSANSMGGHRNILLVANYESDVGYAWWLMEKFWTWISELAEARGRETLLIYPRINQIPNSIAASRIQVRELRFPAKSDESTAPLERLVIENKIGIVYLTDRPYASPIYRTLRKLGVQTIINHDHTPGSPTPGSVLKWLPRRISILAGTEYCDHYIAVSNYVQQKQVYGSAIPKAISHVIQNGIEIAPARTPADRQNVRRELGYADNDVVVVSVGRADTYKGIDFLIACARITRDTPNLANLRFLHCGSGPDLELFRETICALRIQRHFRCLGHRDDVSKVLAGCDIAVHASPAEAGSLAILEYMAAGLPVLAPPGGANREQIVNEVTGLFYKFRDSQDLITKLSKFHASSTLRDRMGTAGRERVKEFFNVSLMRTRFDALFGRLLIDPERDTI